MSLAVQLNGVTCGFRSVSGFGVAKWLFFPLDAVEGVFSWKRSVLFSSNWNDPLFFKLPDICYSDTLGGEGMNEVGDFGK